VGSSVTATHSLIYSNTATYGGGLFVAGNTLTAPAEATCLPGAPSAPGDSSVYLLDGTQVLSNTAGAEGGGVAIYAIQTVIDASEVRYNAASLGGGVHNEGQGLCDGPALASGAALTAESFADLQLTVSGGSVIADNVAFDEFEGGGQAPEYVYGSGGGVFNFGTTAAILDSQVISNVALYVGGGLGNVQGLVLISNTQVISNAAIFYGGGIGTSIGLSDIESVCPLEVTAPATGLSGVALVGSEVRGNFAIFGGGLANDNSLAIIDSTLVTHNFSGSGGGLYNESASCLIGAAQGASEELLATMTVQNGSEVSHNFANGEFGSFDNPAASQSPLAMAAACSPVRARWRYPTAVCTPTRPSTAAAWPAWAAWW
jgi:hypothetical protein